MELRDDWFGQHFGEFVLDGHDAVLLGFLEPLAGRLVDARLVAGDAEMGGLSAWEPAPWEMEAPYAACQGAWLPLNIVWYRRKGGSVAHTPKGNLAKRSVDCAYLQ